MARRSFSQLSTFSTCPERYRLQKILKVPEPPAVWLPAGSAAGLACDDLDLGYPFDIAVYMFEQNLERMLTDMEIENEMPREDFEVNGKTKANPAGKDQAWWVENFPPMLERYNEWRRTSGYTVATVNGKPAIELEVNLDLGNGTLVVGYLDRLYIRPNGKLEVLDLKSGTSQPGDYQLVTYAYAVGIQYGLDVPYGSFYMLAKDGKSTPKWLPSYTSGNSVQQTYRRLDESIRNGHFVPRITGDCFRCPMAKACDFGGQK